MIKIALRFDSTDYTIPVFSAMSTSRFGLGLLTAIFTAVILSSTTLQASAQSRPRLAPGDYAVTTERIVRDVEWYHDTTISGTAVIGKGTLVKILNYVKIRRGGRDLGMGYTFEGRATSSTNKERLEYGHGIFKTAATSDKFQPVPSGWGKGRSPDILRNGRKPFLVTTDDLDIEIGGLQPSEGFYFDIVRMTPKQIWITDVRGDQISVSRQAIGEDKSAEIRYLEWDTANHRPVSFSPTRLESMFFFGPTFYSYPILAILFFGAAIFYWRTAALDRGTKPTVFLLGCSGILIFTYLHYQGGADNADLQEHIGTYFHLHLTQEGYFLPAFRPEFLSREGASWVEGLACLYGPLTLFLFAAFFYLFPSFIRGFHYLTLRYPTDEHLVHDDSDLPPDIDEDGLASDARKTARKIAGGRLWPAWMARNKAKKARANRKWLDAIIDNLKAARRYKRERSRHTDDD